MTQANKNFGIATSSAATRREITGMNAEAQGTQSGRILDSAKETGLRSQGTNQQFGMMKYDAYRSGLRLPERPFRSEKESSFTTGTKVSTFCRNPPSR